MSKNRKKHSKQPCLTDKFSANPFSQLDIDLTNTTGDIDNTGSEKGVNQAFAPDRSAKELVIRVEKKGRRGKTVTILEGFGDMMTSGEIHELSRVLKRALGIGGSIINNTIELQGDNRIKLEEELRKAEGRKNK